MKGFRVAFAIVFALLLAAGGSAAYAYVKAVGITSTGTGSSSAGGSLTITSGTPTAALYPGGTAPIALTIVNPGAAVVHVNSLSLDTGQGAFGFAVDAGHSGCATSVLTYTAQSTGWDVPAHGSLPVTLPASALAMSASAANACQGAHITVYLKVG